MDFCPQQSVSAWLKDQLGNPSLFSFYHPAYWFCKPEAKICSFDRICTNIHKHTQINAQVNTQRCPKLYCKICTKICKNICTKFAIKYAFIFKDQAQVRSLDARHSHIIRSWWFPFLNFLSVNGNKSMPCKYSPGCSLHTLAL